MPSRRRGSASPRPPSPFGEQRSRHDGAYALANGEAPAHRHPARHPARRGLDRGPRSQDEKERVMEYRSLGKTGLTVSVAGLGCGGNSRLGLGRGASFDDCVAVVRTAVDLGVNFLDTAEAYGTEEIVGAAARSYDRDRLVVSTKAIFRGTDDTGETVTRRVDAALQRLGLDYVDIFHFHAVNPVAYEDHRDVLAPALLRLKEQGKV